MSELRNETIRHNYDRIAPDYANHLYQELNDKPLDRALLDRFAGEVRKDGLVCDVGCGPGHVSRYLRDRGCKIFGIDLSPAMVHEAKRLEPAIQFSQGDMMALDLEDQSLAGIVAFYSLVNYPEDSHLQAFHEFARVLKPDASLLLAFHTGNEILHVTEMWRRPADLVFFFFDPESVRSKLQSAGFTVSDVILRGPYSPDVEHQSHRAYIFARTV